MREKISFLQKVTRWGARKGLFSAGEASSLRRVTPSETFDFEGGVPSGCPTSSRCPSSSSCFGTALSHEVLFKMMVMVLIFKI